MEEVHRDFHRGAFFDYDYVCAAGFVVHEGQLAEEVSGLERGEAEVGFVFGMEDDVRDAVGDEIHGAACFALPDDALSRGIDAGFGEFEECGEFIVVEVPEDGASLEFMVNGME